jgi:hypothetical protein
MKKLVGLFAVLAMVLGFSGFASAEAKWVNAVPSCDSDGNVTIPVMPAGTELLNVVVYHRDGKGTRNTDLGPVHSFKLDPANPDEGFLYTWKDKEGTWYFLVDSYSKFEGLRPECSDSRGCIIVRKK